MNLLRVLLSPFAWLYALVLKTRHALYDLSILNSTRPAVPTIVIGNLALGGTGKTPHVELVIDILKHSGPIATLSRGYGRKGNEFREVQLNDDPASVGDEPLQLKQKDPGIHVFVGADRIRSIGIIHQKIPDLKAIVLDDALQHRRLNASLNILLTTWNRPYFKDALLPAGRLRDVTSRAKAAQIVIVTKCPLLPSIEEKDGWRRDLHLRSDQELFFSGIEYSAAYSMEDRSPIEISKEKDVLLVTGIADPQPLVDHFRPRCSRLEHFAFPDHHRFTKSDLQRLKERSGKFAPEGQLIVTTEKDAVRLRPLIEGGRLGNIPIAVIGIRAVLLNGSNRFGALIKEHVGKDKAHR